MWTGNISRQLHQLPVTIAWRIAIVFARKSLHRNITICDVTSTESRYRGRFDADVTSVLDELALTSPEQLQGIQKHIRYIARAEIRNGFEYFARARLLLLNVDYRRDRSDLRTSIKRYIAEAAILADQRFPQRS
jgi:hypothetical protein